MQVAEALRVEGTARYTVLCYAIFATASVSSASDALRAIVGANTEVFALHEEGWPAGILVNEVSTEDADSLPHVIANVMKSAFDAGPCQLAVCMYDAAFGTFDDVLHEETARQTYAFCFKANAPVIALDELTQSSREWEALISLARKQFLQVRM